MRGLEDLKESAGCEMRELEPLERQLRSQLAHMGILDPSQQEAPPPLNTDSDRIMMPTKSSQFRASALIASLPQTGVGGGGGGEGDEPLDLNALALQRQRKRSDMRASKIEPPPIVASASIGVPEEAGRKSPTAGSPSADGKEGVSSQAPGAALEEAIVQTTTEVRKLEAVRELLVELRAIDAPPKYVLKAAREVEAKRDYVADAIRRGANLEAQHEHLAHFLSQVRGALDFLRAADAFDYRRQKYKVAGEYAQLGLQSMTALRHESEARRLRDRGLTIEHMQHYIEQELPTLERAARERVEACATLHLTIPTEVLQDDALQGALTDDLEDWMGVRDSGSNVHPRLRVAEVQPPPRRAADGRPSTAASSALCSIAVLEGPGRSVEELLQVISPDLP